MITREGMETAFIVNALALKTQSMEMLAGAALGIGLAALLAWAWTRYGQRVRLDLFFQVTSIFLLLFAAQLMIYSFHELSEAGILPLDNEYWHELTEPYGPAGRYGQWLSVALVFAPVTWMMWWWLKTRGMRQTTACAPHAKTNDAWASQASLGIRAEY